MFVIADAVAEPPVNVPLAPLAGAANVTFTLATGLLVASYTVAWKGFVKATFVAVLCGVPPVAVTVAGVPTSVRFVSKKFAGVVTPDAVAVTVYGPPATPFALNVGAVATPCVFVTTIAVDEPPINVPLAPVLGAANVTMIPFAGFPPLVTVAASGANGEPVEAL